MHNYTINDPVVKDKLVDQLLDKLLKLCYHLDYDPHKLIIKMQNKLDLC